MIKTVIFDLGQVIVPFDFQRAYQTLSSRYGLDIKKIPQQISSTDLFIRYESGQISTPDFVQALTSHLGFSATVPEFGEIWSSIFERRTLIPESLFAVLKKNGYRLVLLSNTNQLHFDFIRENYPVLGYFDHYVLSHEAGVMKPSPAIYAEAIRHALCQPHECFYTDDIEKYAEGAKQAGIDAVQFKNYEQLREELLARGVNIESA